MASGIHGFYNAQAVCPTGTCAATHLFTGVGIEIITRLKRLFMYMNARIEFTGSAYEKTMIGDQIEFDVQIVMYKKDVEIVPDPDRAGRFTMAPKPNAVEKYKSFLTDGKINPQNFSNTFHADIQKIINSDPDFAASIKLRKSGVATKADITKDAQFIFCVDIVPTIEVRHGKFPDYTFNKYVPKPDAAYTGADLTWRKSYSMEEKKHIKHMGRGSSTCKIAIRIFKAMKRVDPSLCPLTSYHIKNIVMHYEHDNQQVSWSMKQLPERVTDIMKYAAKTLQSGQLPDFFESGINLYHGIMDTTRKQLSNRLMKLATDLHEQRTFFSKRSDDIRTDYRELLKILHDLKVEHQQERANQTALEGYTAVSQTQEKVQLNKHGDTVVGRLFKMFYYKD